MSIVVVGSVFVDIKGFPEGEYDPGGRNAGRVEQVHGGVARNVAEDAAAAGQKVVFVGLADDTGAGEDVIRRLRDRGVETRFMERRPGGMGLWLAVFDSRGEAAASVSRRPDLRPLAEILRRREEEIFSGAEGILFELDLEEETVALVCALGEKYAVPVCAAVSNMAIALERRAYLPRLTSLVCNRQELGLLSPGDWEGLAPEALASRLEAVRKETGLPSLAVTLGAEGAVWSENGAWGRCPAAPAELVDTTGAGDAFFAGVGVGLCRGRSLAEACRIGALLAAGAVGSRESVCPPTDPKTLGL